MSQHGTAPPGTRTRSAAQHLTLEELRAARQRTVLDALRQLRPEFLVVNSRSRGRTMANGVPVFENGMYVGGVEMLAGIPVAAAIEIERLSESRARELFGSYCTCLGGVIHVRTR